MANTLKGNADNSFFLGEIMEKSFKSRLLSSLPYQDDDEYESIGFESPPEKAKRAINIFTARGIKSTTGLIQVARNESEEENLRIEAMCFICNLGASEAIDSLQSIANAGHESLSIRRCAIGSLYTLKAESIFEIMHSLLLEDPSVQIRVSVVECFACYPNPRLFDLLTTVVFSDSSWLVRGRAIRQLGIYCGEESKSKVFKIFCLKLQDPEEHITVHAFAIEGFAHLLDLRALDIVIDNLNHQSPEIRLMAVYSLGHLGDFRHLSRLEEMRSDHGEFKNWGTVAEEVSEAILRIQERLL